MAGLTTADSQLLDWDVNKSKMQQQLGDLVQYFQVGISTNDLGVPQYYIDPTVLLPYLLDIESPDDLSDDIVDSAKTPIEFSDGLPTVEGVPLWERLEGEPIPYYNLFKEYREMKYCVVGDANASLTRSIAKLSASSSMPGKNLSALSKVYHWQVRAKAYDGYKQLEKEIMRQRNVEMLEEKHAKVSNQLLDQAVNYLTQHPEQLSPKVAIDLAKLAMGSGRLALGLNPDKPGSTSGSSGGGGAHISIVNQNANSEGSVSQGNMNLSDVEKKTKENAQDVNHLQSILHVLNQSGAFENAIMSQEEKEAAINASFTVEE